MRHLEFHSKANNMLYIKNDFLDNEKCGIFIAAKNCNTVNYSQKLGKIRKFEKHLIHFETGISPDKIFFLNQKHEDNIIKIDSPCNPEDLFIDDADAMITDVKNYVLVIRTADCIPVMVYDEKKKCIAAIHSGWRSTEKKITSKAIEKLKTEYNSDPKDLKAYLLPGIDKNNYEVSREVAEKFPGCFAAIEDKFYLDLKTHIHNELLDCGFNEFNIFNSFENTYDFDHKYFSHRKGDEGRNLNYIYLK